MPELDKKELGERDICTKFITPALTAGGKWDSMSQIREEVSFTKGRVIVRGQLSTRGEAKDNNNSVGAGLIEQKRIVARVGELLRWCDTLEAQLHQTRTLGAHLLASTLHQILEPAR